MIFKTTLELAKHAKINKSLEFGIIEPYIEQAMDQYINPYLGMKLLDKVEAFYVLTPEAQATKDNSDLWSKLLLYIQKTAAPFAVLVAVDETSINFGDTGHTVSRTDKLAPASDAKIAKYKSSLKDRSWFNLEQLLSLLEQHPQVWPEWQAAPQYHIRKGNFFSSAEEFQNKGLVDIQYSRLTFEKLRMPIQSLDVTEVKPLLGEAYNPLVKKTYTETQAPTYQELQLLVCRFLAHRAACVFSAVPANELDYQPVIKPLTANTSNNFYCEQATLLASEISNYIIANAEKLGITVESLSLNWNSEERKLVAFV